MGNKRFLFILLTSIICIPEIFSQECSTNLECKSTGCCHDNKCSEKSDCRKRNKLCYAFVGVGAFVVLVVIIIYFVRKIRETKKHLEYLRKTDPGSLTRREQFRMSQNQNTMVPTQTN